MPSLYFSPSLPPTPILLTLLQSHQCLWKFFYCPVALLTPSSLSSSVILSITTVWKCKPPSKPHTTWFPLSCSVSFLQFIHTFEYTIKFLFFFLKRLKFYFIFKLYIIVLVLLIYYYTYCLFSIPDPLECKLYKDSCHFSSLMYPKCLEHCLT